MFNYKMSQPQLGCTEQLWFKLVAIGIGAFTLGFAIANAVFYGKIQSQGGCGAAISGSDSTLMLWINVILAVLGFILLAFGIWRLILSYERRNKIQAAASDQVQKAAVSTQSIEDAPSVQNIVQRYSSDLTAAANTENVAQVGEQIAATQSAFA